MATKKAGADVKETGPSARQLTIPIGSFVKYTGKRVGDHVGLSGEVIGYRGPTTGLWIKFSDGSKGSISLTQAEVLKKAPKKAQARTSTTASKKAKAAKAEQPAPQAEVMPEAANG